VQKRGRRCSKQVRRVEEDKRPEEKGKATEASRREGRKDMMMLI
jgi:hypothetical protein